MVRYRQGFVAIARDPEWPKKLGLAVLINFIPYLGMIWVQGWHLEYQRRVAWGADERLPEWTDFRGQVMAGLNAFVAVLPYSMVLSFLITPMLVLAVAASFWLTASSGNALMPFVITWGLTYALLTLGTMLIYPLTASVTVRVALFGTLESGFQFREIWRLMRVAKRELLRAWGYVTAHVMAVVLFPLVVTAPVAVLAGRSYTGPESLPLSLLAIVAAYGLSTLVAAVASAPLGVANCHYLGSYGRVAYGLEGLAAPDTPGSAST